MIKSDKMRTFICIDFPLEIEKEIERIQKIILKNKFKSESPEIIPQKAICI